MPGIGNNSPGGAGQVPGAPDAGVVGISPSDMPMWRVAAEPIDSPCDGSGEPKKNVGNRRPRNAGIGAGDLLLEGSGFSRQSRFQQGHGSGHDGGERTAQAGSGFSRRLAGVKNLAADLVANFNSGQIARKNRRQRGIIARATIVERSQIEPRSTGR